MIYSQLLTTAFRITNIEDNEITLVAVDGSDGGRVITFTGSGNPGSPRIRIDELVAKEIKP